MFLSLFQYCSIGDIISSALNLITAFCMMALTIYYRKFMKLTAVEIDNANISI